MSNPSVWSWRPFAAGLALCLSGACATPTNPSSLDSSSGSPATDDGGTGGISVLAAGGSFSQAGAPAGGGGSSGQMIDGAGAGASLGQSGAASSSSSGASGGASLNNGGFGGKSTGGASGASSSGSDGACANPVDVMGTNTGNFGTMAAACFKTKTVFSGGWNCSSTDGRTIRINGRVLACGVMPVPPQIDGYTYIEATAGTYTWAQVYWWT